jgi:site-specific DNA-adenine methylase
VSESIFAQAAAFLGGGAGDALPRADVEKTIWGSPAGKKRLAKRLVGMIPTHKTYVEPFAGSGAVFFEKEPSEVEVLSDADPDIAFAYRALKSLSPGELESLKKRDWVGRESTFRRLSKAQPAGKVDRLHKFLYTSHFAYGKLRGKSFNPNADGVTATTLKRIDKFQPRLKNATIRQGHYAKVVKDYDGKDTFFFLDPPYPGHNVEVGEDEFDEDEFRDVLDSIKGRFLVTYGTRGNLDTSGFQVKKIRVPRSIRTMRGVEGPQTLPQLLISNYSPTSKALGGVVDGWAFDDVDGVLELDADLGGELERARALVQVVGDAHPRQEILALATELSQIEPAPIDTGAAAHELAALAEELAPELAGAGSVAKALQDALPALVEIVETTKATWSRAFINDLPDSAFLYIEPGGKKDGGGKTVPRSLRHFPVRDADGEADVPHLRNALARIPQSTLPAKVKEQAAAEARRLLERAEKAEEVEKRRFIPFQQWGGSAKYARRLAERLPEHKRYVEPFCGSAAVFYAKEAAPEEVLADANPDVVAAHKFIQKLDEKSLAELRKFSWTVSRAGLERARKMKPKTDAERFWKLAYGRMAAYGAKPDLSGYSTVHEGSSYDLEDLWPFNKRLKGATVVHKDWRQTLKDHDGPGTLFFIDPPYIEEWAQGDGVPPEEVAEAVSKLKGDYVIAYTNSARARKALSEVGTPFTLKIPEGRGAGLWQKRARLFVSSKPLAKAVTEPEPAALPAEAAELLRKSVSILKAEDERFILGVVLEPETVDSQKDIYSVAEVRQAAHKFMEQFRNSGLMHQKLVNDRVKIVESYLTMDALTVGDQSVRKGTWLMGMHILDQDLWGAVKTGEITGLSIGGSALRNPE